MSNRTDFSALARELMGMIDDATTHTISCNDRIDLLDRLETELHNAYVAGEEGNGCECRWCLKATIQADAAAAAATTTARAKDG